MDPTIPRRDSLVDPLLSPCTDAKWERRRIAGTSVPASHCRLPAMRQQTDGRRMTEGKANGTKQKVRQKQNAKKKTSRYFENYEQGRDEKGNKYRTHAVNAVLR